MYPGIAKPSLHHKLAKQLRIQCQFENTWTLCLQTLEAPERNNLLGTPFPANLTMYVVLDFTLLTEWLACISRSAFLLQMEVTAWKWTINKTKKQRLPSAANRQHVFFLKVKKVTTFMFLENSFPDKTKAKILFTKILKMNKLILVLKNIVFSYYTVLYSIKRPQLKQNSNQITWCPLTPRAPCGPCVDRNNSFQAGIYSVSMETHKDNKLQSFRISLSKNKIRMGSDGGRF